MLSCGIFQISQCHLFEEAQAQDVTAQPAALPAPKAGRQPRSTVAGAGSWLPCSCQAGSDRLGPNLAPSSYFCIWIGGVGEISQVLLILCHTRTSALFLPHCWLRLLAWFFGLPGLSSALYINSSLFWHFPETAFARGCRGWLLNSGKLLRNRLSQNYNYHSD